MPESPVGIVQIAAGFECLITAEVATDDSESAAFVADGSESTENSLAQMLEVEIEHWVQAVLANLFELKQSTEQHPFLIEKLPRPGCYSVAVRLVSSAEMKQLNTDFRNRPALTNVLSFPAKDGVEEGGADLMMDSLVAQFAQEEEQAQAQVQVPLGDIAICAAVVIDEAKSQEKSAPDHLVHMLTHGILHLLDYDHETDADAEAMEALERAILAKLGVADPYILTGDTRNA